MSGDIDNIIDGLKRLEIGALDESHLPLIDALAKSANNFDGAADAITTH